MAEPSPDFDADQFRADIRAAMLMGFPNVVQERPTFHFADNRVFADENEDLGNEPWDWKIADGPDEGAPPKDPISVLCAVDPVGAGQESDQTPVGSFNTDRVFLYLFEEEWAKVSDFTTVWLGGSEYRRIKRLQPLGLHDVDVQVIEVRARDEA